MSLKYVINSNNSETEMDEIKSITSVLLQMTEEQRYSMYRISMDNDFFPIEVPYIFPMEEINGMLEKLGKNSDILSTNFNIADKYAWFIENNHIQSSQSFDDIVGADVIAKALYSHRETCENEKIQRIIQKREETEEAARESLCCQYLELMGSVSPDYRTAIDWGYYFLLERLSLLSREVITEIIEKEDYLLILTEKLEKTNAYENLFNELNRIINT